MLEPTQYRLNGSGPERSLSNGAGLGSEWRTVLRGPRTPAAASPATGGQFPVLEGPLRSGADQAPWRPRPRLANHSCWAVSNRHSCTCPIKRLTRVLALLVEGSRSEQAPAKQRSSSRATSSDEKETRCSWSLWMTFMGFSDTGFHRKHADAHPRHAASGHHPRRTSCRATQREHLRVRCSPWGIRRW